jgi:hypothetical protein
MDVIGVEVTEAKPAPQPRGIYSGVERPSE